MAVDVSGLSFFMPIFSFLFVFVIIYALLAKSKILGESKFIHLLISFIVAVVFISFSSIRLYVQTILPWFAVLVVVAFLVLLLGMFSSKDWSPKAGLAWVFIAILGIIFLVSAIYVFNPVFHPDLGVASGEGESLISQIRDYASSSSILGTVLLIIVAIVVSWVLTKK